MKNWLNYFITFLVILGVLLNVWGIVFNQTALIFNNNEMPVNVSFFIEDKNYNGKFKHKATDDNTRVKLLTDWIEIDFPQIEEPSNLVLNKIYFIYKKYLNYPVEGGLNFVSIGDLMRWSGTTLFLLFLVPLIILIPFKFLKDKNASKINR